MTHLVSQRAKVGHGIIDSGLVTNMEFGESKCYDSFVKVLMYGRSTQAVVNWNSHKFLTEIVYSENGALQLKVAG